VKLDEELHVGISAATDEVHGIAVGGAELDVFAAIIEGRGRLVEHIPKSLESRPRVGERSRVHWILGQPAERDGGLEGDDRSVASGPSLSTQKPILTP
jgi:hypothetical protein